LGFGILITKVGEKNPRGDNIMMFDINDCADKCLGQSWGVSIMNCYKCVT
jgi:hypothetical protein